tara:strand:+ start:912 stop:1082 length:171 start_codon:yes stop_codon:yes gene_type:complete
MYKLQINKNIITGELKEPIAVILTTDGACIPFDPANTDYAEYLEWVAEGGIPEAAD